MTAKRTCSVDDCGSDYRVVAPRAYGKPLCSRHVQRYYKHGDPTGGGGWTTHRGGHLVCQFDGCGRWHKAKGYCEAHYVQAHRYGIDPRPIGRPKADSRDCTYCDNPAAKMGLCHTHYGRLQRGTPLDTPVIPLGQPRIDWAHGEAARNCGVAGAHGRVKRLWGTAGQYPCVECDEQAAHWAYDGADPTQMLGRHGDGMPMWYSAYPEFYMPMCRKCHKGRDAALAAQELSEYRTWRAETGLRITDLITGMTA